MIKNILDLLEVVNGGSERIHVAKGKNYLPETFTEAYKQAKENIRWQKNI